MCLKKNANNGSHTYSYQDKLTMLTASAACSLFDLKLIAQNIFSANYHAY